MAANKKAAKKTTRKRAPVRRKKRVVNTVNRRQPLSGSKGRGKKRAEYYVSCLGRRGPLSIWLVDGAYIRKNIDEEFSNFGHHYSFEEIPKREIWLDKEGDADEMRFFIHHAMVERRLMVRGKDYDDARAQANKEERRMRAKAGDLRKVISGKGLPDSDKVHMQLWKTLPDGTQVWMVSGRLVRSVYDIEFTEGGHEHVYEYIPRGEVWIDDDIHENERGFVLFHELYERNLMKNGMDYDTAHDRASKKEKHYRHHPDELHEALAAEGWE